MSETEYDTPPEADRFRDLFERAGLTVEQAGDGTGRLKAETDDGDVFWYRKSLHHDGWVVDPYPNRGSFTDKFTVSLSDLRDRRGEVTFTANTYRKRTGSQMRGVQVRIDGSGMTVTENY